MNTVITTDKPCSHGKKCKQNERCVVTEHKMFGFDMVEDLIRKLNTCVDKNLIYKDEINSTTTANIQKGNFCSKL